MKIHIIQHLEHENAGFILDWANERHHHLSFSFLFEPNIAFPDVDDFDMLVILGGTMSVHDEKKFKWLKAEKEFIKQTIQANKIIAAICLGSQLLAEALGSKVYRNKYKEIGFFPVRKTNAGRQDNVIAHIPETWQVFHWHGDTFDIPQGAVHLFYSDACQIQAFRKDKMIGLQFHPEMNTTLLKAMINFERDELIKSSYVQTEAELFKNDTTSRNKIYFFELLDKIIQ